MATEVIMPKVDMVMDNGTFVEWLKKEGDRVEKGEPLFIILTDKANIEVEAPDSGILAGLKAQPDDVIPVTEVIAYILEPGESVPAGEKPALPAVQEAKPPVPTAASPATATAEVPPPVSDSKVRATPAARHLARELGVELTQVAGSGARGRVHRGDVELFASQLPAASEAPLERPAGTPSPATPTLELPLPDARQKQVVPLAGPRKIIAQRMAYSAFTAPHITLSLGIDMTEAGRLHARLEQPIQHKTQRRLSYTAILARAVASVLPHHPYLNASLQGDNIILWEDIHLGVAMSLEDYLIVPVIREAQGKTLQQMVTTLGDLVERARAKRLKPAEMSGSTFTISNLGMFGIESFTAIINPPESAILAVGKIVDTPVKAENGVEFRPVMNLTISVDHRVVDGASAARFLAELKETLENPYLLV